MPWTTFHNQLQKFVEVVVRLIVGDGMHEASRIEVMSLALYLGET
jgi:hypothetical protein